MKDPAIREAVKSERAMRALDKLNAPRDRRPAAASLIVQWVEQQAGTGKVRRQVARPDRAGRKQASGRRDARSVARHRSQGRIPQPEQQLQRRLQCRDHQRLARTPSRASPTAARIPSSSAGGAFTTDFLSLAGARRAESHARRGALSALRAARACRWLPRSRRAARRRGGRRRRLRPQDLASSPNGSARSRTICRAANGVASSAPRLSLDHRQRRETFADGRARARRRGDCCATAAPEGVPRRPLTRKRCGRGLRESGADSSVRCLGLTSSPAVARVKSFFLLTGIQRRRVSWRT